jgi:uncharacterized 2Fe-2S/4Fe-4S cluster protein (DUF4445 family)
MSEHRCRVTFEPQGQTVHVLAGTTIREAAAEAGLVIDTPCGGVGTCGKCKVQVIGGSIATSVADRHLFSEDELLAGWRLACQNVVTDDMTVSVPEASLYGARHQVTTGASTGGPQGASSTIRKLYVELAPPTLADNRPDLLRLEDRVGRFKVGLTSLRHIPVAIRGNGYKGTAVLADHSLIGFEAGDTVTRCFGVAFDIGTTSMVGSLVSLCTGQELAVVSRLNPQVRYGSDVLSRIRHSASCAHCLNELHSVIVEETAAMIEELQHEADINAHDIYEVVFAGNTVMQHLLCGVDPTPLGEVPFAPAYARGLLLASRDMNIPIHPNAPIYVFPVIGGFVGGDTVAGMLATEIDASDGPVLMVDIGTNGELVLAHDKKLYAASTAAGPAFEGARISCGMRGIRGAIEKVICDEDIHLGVIGGVSPIGICGSGMIDLVAELLNHGIVSPEGQLLPPEELPAGLPSPLSRRVQRDRDGQIRFLLAEADPGNGGRTIALTQRDVRELQLGCGAIRAGVRILLKQAGLAASDLEKIFIAGSFGSFIRRDNAQRVGLIPQNIASPRIHYVGNVSLAGAKWALVSQEARKRAEEIARTTRHVELSNCDNFQVEFAEAMVFPDRAMLM